jgi:hypothetical protein
VHIVPNKFIVSPWEKDGHSCFTQNEFISITIMKIVDFSFIPQVHTIAHNFRRRLHEIRIFLKEQLVLIDCNEIDDENYLPGRILLDSDAGPRCITSLTKIPSFILPHMLNPRPVKSWPLRATLYLCGS